MVTESLKYSYIRPVLSLTSDILRTLKGEFGITGKTFGVRGLHHVLCKLDHPSYSCVKCLESTDMNCRITGSHPILTRKQPRNNQLKKEPNGLILSFWYYL